MSRINLTRNEKNDVINCKECCGCEACAVSCPKNAITMAYDSEGFYYPVVDEGKCVDCGICEKQCPMINVKKPQEYVAAYAGYSTDAAIIEKCASGGVCTALSRRVINSGGIVFGVKYSDDFIKSEYAAAETPEELESFMTSKYVQSRKNDIFKRVKEEVETGRQVAFFGCPCDVAALSIYLKKDYDNLLLCELICMGVTSFLVADEYIKSKTKRYGKLVGFNSKGKKYGWFVPSLEEKYESKKIINKPFFGTYYGLGFTKLQRPSCSQCPYRGKTGRGDLRVGDFWGIKKTDEFWNPKGVSSIFVRTEKGDAAVNALTSDNFSLFAVAYEKAADNNNMDLGKNYSESRYEKRMAFSSALKEKGLFAACKESASTQFWIKHFVPYAFANFLKHLRHAVTDIKHKG